MPDRRTAIAGAAATPLRPVFFRAGPTSVALACLLFLALLAAFMTGCGGGGGGDGGDADPLAPEIGAQVDGFVDALNAENIDGAMRYVDSNIYYFRAGTNGFLRYSAFQEYLRNFVESASGIILSIDGREFTSNGETWALCAGTLNCSWKDAEGNARTLTEPVQIEWQRIERWGITKLSRYDTTGLQFPPAP
ncbi:MAG TPA: hypothetical protein PLU72_03735 [Candidatus Ozemobacteraceae bacterium]|nr:hypothetical protein [Candidatus Ozemobacteraceae bacterium]HQG27212.1 hypothetical protein [Candidatus Ozemobacteraceae bacterium]